MDLRQITPDFFVSPQIDPADLPQIAAAGFTHILCNRPDSEVPPSHTAAEIEAAAKDAGLQFAALPLTHQTMTAENIAANKAHIENSDKLLAYCASGTRSTIAWALGQAGDVPADDLIAAAAAAGYDISQLKGTLS